MSDNSTPISAKFTSNKAYLLRAIYDWILDNDATPYLLVDALIYNVEVPQQHIKDGQIVLNIMPSAIQNWHVDNTAVSFSARFSGQVQNIYLPMNSIMAIYAHENGLGMAFPEEAMDENVESSETHEQAQISEKKNVKKETSHLKIVK